MKHGSSDFTQGKISRQLITFSAPIMLANLLQISYQLIDSLWVGNLLGAQALGAVAVASTIIFTVLSFVLGMNNAALAILSQQKGKKNNSELKRYLNAFVVILFVLALLLGITGFFAAETLLLFLGTPTEILGQSLDYLRITFIGMLFLFGYNFLATALRATGDSKTPMKFVLLAVILNTFLDPLFIYVFNWNIRGAAIATVFSQGAAFIYGLFYIYRKQLLPLQKPQLPGLTETKLILQLGIPAGLQMAVISAGSAAIMSVVNGFGADVVGGFGAAQRLDSLIMLPAQAIGIAVSSMAGQNIGINNWDRVNKISKTALGYNLLFMLAIALTMVLTAKWAIGLFVNDQESIRFGTQYIRTIAFFYPFLGINFVLNGIVRASGAMYQVLILNLISFWVLRYPLTFIAAKIFGDIGIAYGVGLSFVVSSLVAFLYFRFGKWRQKELFQSGS